MDNRRMNERQPKSQFEARMSMINPNNIWTPEAFHRMISRICQEEIADAPAEISSSDYERLRAVIIANINAHVVPAGNA